MKVSYKLRLSSTMVATTILIAACGGGGSSPIVSSTSTLTGTAATGRAFPVGSIISVRDATGAEVGSTTLISTDGTFSIPIASSAKAPLVITASADDEETLVSIKADTSSGNVNITPQTNLIAASLSPSGNPAQLAAEIKNGTATVTQTTIDAKVKEVQTLLSPVTTALNMTIDPLTTSFKADGTGLDRVLDSVKISVQPQGDGSSQVQIAIRADDDTVAKPVGFKTGNGNTTKLDSQKLPAVTSAALPQAGLITQVNSLLKRLEACYNLPKSSRVDGLGTTPSSIKAAECKSVYWNSDPSTYTHNSYTVGATSNSRANAWSTLFTNSDTTKLAWDQGAVQFVIQKPSTGQQEGDVVFTSRWTATFPCANDATQTCSNTAVDTYVVRADNNGKLYLIGNQSNYDLGVDARADLRDLPNFKDANSNSYNYLSVGYNVYVEDTGSISKVVVTTPTGNTLVLKPIAGSGYSYLGLTKGDGTVTNASVVRLSGAYLNPNTTSSSGANSAFESTNHPRDIDGNLFWAANVDNSNKFVSWKNWSDTDLAALPDQGVWTFEIYDKTNSKVATEKRRTINRAPTMAEAKKIIWPELSLGLRNSLATKTSGESGFALSSAAPLYITSDMSATGGAGWVVPAGAWAPLSVKAYGNYKTTTTNISGFDDNTDVRSSMRKTTIYCSGSDGHCEGTSVVSATSGAFKPFILATTPFSAFYQLQLNGRDSRRVQNSVTINFRNK